MKKKVILLSLAIFVFAFYKFGRSLYMPVVNNVKGKETVETIISKIEKEVWNRLKSDLAKSGYRTEYPKEIVLVAFKEEQILQVYAKNSTGVILIKDYPFTANSGNLGPKLKEGDRQIPEGIYEVEYLNPNSSYYLSIKINYPNEFDKSKTQFNKIADMGGDIFIHGKSATIGCIPIGDMAIEEVFLLTTKANKSKVKVIISPRDFRTNDTYPVIPKINWEQELYKKIHKELQTLDP